MPRLQRKFVVKLLKKPKLQSSDQGLVLFRGYFSFFFFSVKVI